MCIAGSEQTVSDSGQPARDQQEHWAVQQHPERDARWQHDQPGRHERGIPREGERRIRGHGETDGFAMYCNLLYTRYVDWFFVRYSLVTCVTLILFRLYSVSVSEQTNFSDCRLWKEITTNSFWHFLVSEGNPCLLFFLSYASHAKVQFGNRTLSTELLVLRLLFGTAE